MMHNSLDSAHMFPVCKECRAEQGQIHKIRNQKSNHSNVEGGNKPNVI